MPVMNSTVKKAAQEMIKNDITELQRKLSVEGAYHVVVEGGYHQQELSDDDADTLTKLIVDHGIKALLTLTKDEHNDERRNVAQITPLVSTTGSSFEELINRLDDGNEYSGFYLDYDSDMKVYTLYEEGYE